jgi:hypothetical protein
VKNMPSYAMRCARPAKSGLRSSPPRGASASSPSPLQDGLVMELLRYADKLREPSEYFVEVPAALVEIWPLVSWAALEVAALVSDESATASKGSKTFVAFPHVRDRKPLIILAYYSPSWGAISLEHPLKSVTFWPVAQNIGLR